MIHGELVWFIMIHCDSSWFISIHHDSLWFMVIHHDSWWFIMIHHDSLWFIIIHCDSLWFILIHHDSLWFIMIHHNSLWFIMIHHDSLWFIMFHYDSLWFVMIYYDSLGFCGPMVVTCSYLVVLGLVASRHSKESGPGSHLAANPGHWTGNCWVHCACHRKAFQAAAGSALRCLAILAMHGASGVPAGPAASAVVVFGH